jgi:hypothetical protein
MRRATFSLKVVEPLGAVVALEGRLGGEIGCPHSDASLCIRRHCLKR